MSVTVGTTAILIVDADDINREVYLHNAGGGKVYLGGATVTASDGFHVANAESVTIRVPLKEKLYGISASGTNAVIVLLPDGD